MEEPESHTFQRKTGTGKLKLTSMVIEIMNSYTQLRSHQPEAGGILLGRFIAETDDVVVDEVTVPKVGDWSRRTGFRRSAKPHQRVLNDIWYNSNGTCNYLGEWHTHPEPTPSPSGRDLTSWQEQLNRLAPDGNALFFVIIGTQHTTVWEATRNPFTYQQLKKF